MFGVTDNVFSIADVVCIHKTGESVFLLQELKLPRSEYFSKTYTYMRFVSSGAKLQIITSERYYFIQWNKSICDIF